MEEVYSRTQQLREERELGKCEEVSSRIRGKNEYRNRKIEEVGLGKEKGLQEGRTTREVYGKNIIWMR